MLVKPTKNMCTKPFFDSSTFLKIDHNGLGGWLSLRHLAEKAIAGDAEFFHLAPRLAPRRRLDETAAARKPILRWRPPPPADAAE